MLHLPEEIKRFINNNNIILNIFRIQVHQHDLIICGNFSIGFIDFIRQKPKDFMNLFSAHNFRKKDEVVLKFF